MGVDSVHVISDNLLDPDASRDENGSFDILCRYVRGWPDEASPYPY